MNMRKKGIGILICTLMITIVYPTVAVGNTPLSGPLGDLISHDVLVRITTGATAPALPRDVEIESQNPGAWVDVSIPSTKLNELSEMNLPYSILIPDLEAYDAQMAGSYHTLAQIQSILEGIAANHSDIAKLYSIGTTFEGRSIWCLEISDHPGVDEGHPGVFFMGLHHAREWPGAEICLYIANNLTAGYGVNSTITNLVNNRRIWIVPVVNPDGYYYCHDLGNDWRKNRDYFPQYSTYGVDNNRNYNGSCDGNAWGAWGAVSSWAISHYPDNECYDGPGPTSEVEDQAITSIFSRNNISAAISFHTYGEDVMWPWGYSYDVAPDNTYLTSVGQQIASRITVQGGGGTYNPHQSVGLYPTVGDTIDFAYGYGHYVQGRATFAYTIEACNEFHPPASDLDQVCYQNCKGALYLLQEAQNIRDTVVPRVIPPVIAKMQNSTTGNYRVSWQLQNQNANPDYFQLSEMKNLSLKTDDAESGSGFWTLDGFSLTTTKYHSGSHSYKATSGDYQVSSMTTLTPLPITPGMKLSFWCWYSVEQNADYAYVEVSENGRTYYVLDSFTGSSGNWVNKQYSLDNFTGKSLFIRFRYCTDAYGHQDVFYVDDIAPLAHFNSTTILSSTITNNYYDITNQPLGTYYYSVRGHNTVRGWCDNSTLQIINVTKGGGETHPVLSFGNLTSSGPGKLSISVKNIGNADAKKVNMTLRVTGGVFGLIHKEKDVTLPMLPVNQTHIITTDGYLIGFGKIMIYASASCSEAVPPVVYGNGTARILLFFIIPLGL